MRYEVTARRWWLGWELDIDGVGATQTETAEDAETMVRDYLELDGRPDAWTAEVVIIGLPVG